MREIPLSQGKVAIVDDEDFERLSQYKWHTRRSTETLFYARRKPWAGGDRFDILMHREILQAPKGVWVDHVDGNGLNNTRNNLRLCTVAENSRNQKKQSGKSSQFKGVGWSKHSRKWRAYIRIDGKSVQIGLFTNESEAARAYDAVAGVAFGQFARLNFK